MIVDDSDDENNATSDSQTLGRPEGLVRRCLYIDGQTTSSVK